MAPGLCMLPVEYPLFFYSPQARSARDFPLCPPAAPRQGSGGSERQCGTYPVRMVPERHCGCRSGRCWTLPVRRLRGGTESPMRPWALVSRCRVLRGFSRCRKGRILNRFRRCVLTRFSFAPSLKYCSNLDAGWYEGFTRLRSSLLPNEVPERLFAGVLDGFTRLCLTPLPNEMCWGIKCGFARGFYAAALRKFKGQGGTTTFADACCSLFISISV